MSSNFPALVPPSFFRQTNNRRGDDLNGLEQIDFDVLSNYVLNDGPGEIAEKSLISSSELKIPDFKEVPLAPERIQSQAEFHESLQVPQPEFIKQMQKNRVEQNNASPARKRTKLSANEQIERRRERNRVLARKTRLRKKIFFESLQKRVANMKKKNEVLKQIVERRMGEAGKALLEECHRELPKIVTENMDVATEVIQKTDFNLMKSLTLAQRSFCITDPSTPDNPIVYASSEFTELTGYSQEEIIGRNCRFLQGPKTEPSKVEAIRKGISEGKDTSVCLLNYRKDGSTFWNQFFVAALHDVSGAIVNYVGVQCAVPKPS